MAGERPTPKEQGRAFSVSQSELFVLCLGRTTCPLGGHLLFYEDSLQAVMRFRRRVSIAACFCLDVAIEFLFLSDSLLGGCSFSLVHNVLAVWLKGV